MNENNRKRWRVVYYTLVTIALLAAALCLMVACVQIYRTGDHPFTREVVAAAFSRVAVPIYVSLGLVVVGFVLHPLLPAPAEDAPDRDEVTLHRLQRRLSGDDLPEETVAAARAEQRLRLVYRQITWALAVVGTVVFLIYALDIQHFHATRINESMIKAMWVLLPCAGAPFLFGLFAAYQRRRSIRREIELLRTLPAVPAAAEAPAAHRLTAVVRSALLVVAVLAVLFGALGGGWLDVLTKAVNICTECIGLG